MLYLDDLLNDSGIGQMISDMRKHQRIEDTRRKQIKLQREHEKQQMLLNGTQFCIDLYYKSGSEVVFEEIELEGYENFKKIVTKYREIGHDIGLTKIFINLDDKKVHTITFKYND